MSLPAIETLRLLESPAQTEVLDLLFEPSPALHARALPLLQTSSFNTYPELVSVIRGDLDGLCAAATTDPAALATLNSILASHPRLGEPKIESAQSRAEQAKLQQGGEAAEAEAAELRRLNSVYEETFPGLRYVVFVNGRGRPEIMTNMRARIARNDLEAERAAAIEAMALIAVSRAEKLLPQQIA